jgi:hypothetical protein
MRLFATPATMVGAPFKPSWLEWDSGLEVPLRVCHTLPKAKGPQFSAPWREWVRKSSVRADSKVDLFTRTTHGCGLKYSDRPQFAWI